MWLSVCQVRRIVSEYDHSIATFAALYDPDQNDDSELLEAEDEDSDLIGKAEDLYDAYGRAVSSALINAPVLFNVGFNEFEHVLLVPSRFHIDDRSDLETDVGRDRFFRLGLEYLVISALSEALATM